MLIYANLTIAQLTLSTIISSPFKPHFMGICPYFANKNAANYVFQGSQH